MTKLAKNRKLMVVLFALYVTFILISTVPYLAEQNLMRSKSKDEEFVSHLVFPEDGNYGHYKYVRLTNNESVGKIDLKYAFDTNTLYIEKVENIKELEIDCQLLFENRYKEVFGKEPISLEFADFLEENDGIFTVIINTNTPMEKLEFIDTPLPKRVKVNKVDWWETKTSYYTLDQNNITITHIPKGSTTVEIYFKDPGNKSPNAMFSASDYIALRNEQITFDASLSSDEDGEIIDYIWDLGDKTQNISKIITHSYSEAGNYTVILSVRDDDDLVDFYLSLAQIKILKK